MKKYLLLFLMCVYASIGAWAEVIEITSSNYNDFTTNNADGYKLTGTFTDNQLEEVCARLWDTSYQTNSRIDFAEANLNAAQLSLIVLSPCYTKIILPKNASWPITTTAKRGGNADADATYFSATAGQWTTTYANLATANGGFNNNNGLMYIIIPGSTANGITKIILNNSSNNYWMNSFTDEYLQAASDAGGTIEVYNSNNLKKNEETTYTNAYNHIVSTYSKDYSGGATVKEGVVAIPIEYDDCEVTINLAARGAKTMSDLISEAENKLAPSTNICTLIVTGEITTNDLESLDEAETATRIDLSEAKLATSAAITSLQVTSTLESLVLPPNQTVKGTTLETTLSTTNCPNLLYAYSPSSDCTATGPNQADETKSTYSYDATKNTIADYVWVNKAGGLKQAFENEEQLRNSFYIKVASSVALTETDVNFNGCTNKPTNYLFLDFSESNLTPAVAASYKVTDNIGYRIILPNGWTGNQMAVFAANPNCGNLAAVYSYDGTTLKIMEIVDASYSQAALANPRIMRSGTTEVDVVSGYYDGNTYAQFGTNLLAALNNMGKSSFSVTKNDVTTNYTNTLGQSVKTISIETTSAAPNALTFDNPSITTLKAENLVQNNAELNVSACSALTSLSVKGSNLKSVTASGNTSITSADFSGTAIATTTNFNGATKLATFTTTSESIFNGNVDLTKTKLTSFTTAARIGGDVSLNNTNTLTSIDVSGATFTTTTSNIHIDESDIENAENETIITGLTADNCIVIPSSFDKSRLHPAPTDNLVKQISPVVAAVTYAVSDMVFHDAETTGETPDKFRYWYQGTMTDNKIATVGTSATRTLHDVIAGGGTESVAAHADLTNDTHVMIKVVGTMKANDLDSLKYLNATAIDLSDAVIEEGVLAARLKNDNILHTNTKFLILPDTCSREHILNEATLSKQTGVYSVIAINTTDEGRDLTSWSKFSGALQPAVVIAGNRSCQSWTKTPDGENARNIYTSDISNFKKLKISGLINSYDLSKADQKLDADGHLSWAEDVVESTDQTRTLNGAYNVYGPFSACFLLTEIDLRDAYFEPKSTGEDTSVYFRYWYSDMTLSFLNVISTATYKVVIPQNSKVREIPADFMRCSTSIRAICIPSNIQAIRTRAFYTIDYVWTTADAYATGSTTADPEGNNTKLDNGAKLSNGKAVSALLYEHGKYKENPEFENSYYTADYSGDKGGGTYTFGSTLKLIETGAFANTQPNVSDVYVLNTTAPECHVDAFNTVMYTGNGGYNSAKVSSEGIITRDAYYNGRWITMLHYPRQTTDPQIQRYTDPTREYSIATGMRDGKGAILYFPNQSEFIRAYQQGTFGYTWNAWNPTRVYGSVVNGSFNGSTNEWTAELQADANELYNTYKTAIDAKSIKSSVEKNHQYYSFYDTSLGNNTKPTDLVDYYKVNWNPSTYQYSEVEHIDGSAGNLYPKSEKANGTDIDGSGEMTTKDYRGWHQFVLNAYAANTVLEEEPYRSYITDNEWWTIVPEFDITLDESAVLFGTHPKITTTAHSTTYPKIHKLRYVRREYSGETIYLSFTKDLAELRENRGIDAHRTGSYTRTNGDTGEITAYTNADQHGSVGGNGIIEVMGDSPVGDDVVMSAGVPYLIKPNLPANGQRQYRIFKNVEEAGNYNSTRKDTDPVGFGSEKLWAKIKFAQEMNGATQRAMVKSGTYTVPVFVSVTDGENVVKEAVEMDGDKKKTFRPNDEVIGTTEYYRSADRHYTFVGTLYKSFLPHYCYFLGWDSANDCAKFYYHNGNFETIDNEMRWANGTGVIVPVLAEDLSDGKFKYDVTVASDMANPAQWKLLKTFKDDSFVHTSGNSAKQYIMDFNAPDMIAVDDSEVTGIANVDATDNVVINGSADVYTVNGQKVGTSLEGLPKGIYIVNGKKFIVK